MDRAILSEKMLQEVGRLKTSVLLLGEGDSLLARASNLLNALAGPGEWSLVEDVEEFLASECGSSGRGVLIPSVDDLSRESQVRIARTLRGSDTAKVLTASSLEGIYGSLLDSVTVIPVLGGFAQGPLSSCDVAAVSRLFAGLLAGDMAEFPSSVKVLSSKSGVCSAQAVVRDAWHSHLRKNYKQPESALAETVKSLATLPTPSLKFLSNRLSYLASKLRGTNLALDSVQARACLSSLYYTFGKAKGVVKGV